MADKTTETIILPRPDRTGGQLQISLTGTLNGVALALYVGLGKFDNKKMLNNGQPVALSHVYSCPLPDADLQVDDEAVVSAVIIPMQPTDATGQITFDAALHLAGKMHPLRTTFVLKRGDGAGWVEFAWWLGVK